MTMEAVVLVVGCFISGLLLIIFEKRFQGFMCRLGIHKRERVSMGMWKCSNCSKITTREKGFRGWKARKLR